MGCKESTVETQSGGGRSTRQTRWCLHNEVGVSRWYFTRPRTMETALVTLLLCKAHNSQLWSFEVVLFFSRMYCEILKTKLSLILMLNVILYNVVKREMPTLQQDLEKSFLLKRGQTSTLKG